MQLAAALQKGKEDLAAAVLLAEKEAVRREEAAAQRATLEAEVRGGAPAVTTHTLRAQQAMLSPTPPHPATHLEGEWLRRCEIGGVVWWAWLTGLVPVTFARCSLYAWVISHGDQGGTPRRCRRGAC